MLSCAKSSGSPASEVEKLADKIVNFYAKDIKQDISYGECDEMEMSQVQCNKLNYVLDDGIIDYDDAESLKKAGFRKDLIDAIRGEHYTRPRDERAKWLSANINNKKRLFFGFTDNERKDLILQLGRLMTGTKKELPELLNALNDESHIVRDQAAYELGRIGYSDRTVINSLKTLLDNHHPYGCSVIDSMILLGKGYEDVVVPAIMWEPQTKPDNFCNGLDKLGTAAIPYLLEELEKLSNADKNEIKGGPLGKLTDISKKHLIANAIQTALIAIKEIYQSGSKDAEPIPFPLAYKHVHTISLFGKLMNHSYNAVRSDAVWALAAMASSAELVSSETLDLFTKMLTDLDSSVRLGAVNGLQTIKYPNSKIRTDLEKRLIEDDNAKVIDAAFGILMKVDHNFSTGAILTIFEKYHKTEDKSIQSTLKNILVEVQKWSDWKDILTKSILNELQLATSPQTVLAVCKLIGEVGSNDKEIITALEKLRDTYPDKDVRSAANEALFLIKTAILSSAK